MFIQNQGAGGMGPMMGMGAMGMLPPMGVPGPDMGQMGAQKHPVSLLNEKRG